MNIERRFAIVIGINDYEVKPLDCCVNDAKSVAEILENRCRFKKEDIHLITSDSVSPIKDITGHFEKAIKVIENELIAQTDSVLFFFAGHGKFQFEKSGLKFQDSFTEISTIFNRINELQPKYQCYVIDACESGGKVLTRGEDPDDNFVTKFIEKSTGTLFMYAATENESANEYSKLGHGLFTNYFLNAINNDSLYDEGILTPNRIQDFIAKETLKKSNFAQTPVIESRTIGYYPFAFNEQYVETELVITELETERSEDVIEDIINPPVISKQYFPEVPREIREKLFDITLPKFEKAISSWITNFKPEGYEVFEGREFNIFPSDVEDKLKDSVVNTSVKEKILSLDGIFSSERELIKPNPIFAFGSMIDAMLKKNEAEYRYFNYVNWNERNVLAKSIYFKSDSVEQVSFGISFLIYQAVYGIGLVKTSFYLDYNGFVNDKLKGPFTEVKAFKANGETVPNIITQIDSNLKYFESIVAKWNQSRVQAINDFDKKSK